MRFLLLLALLLSALAAILYCQISDPIEVVPLPTNLPAPHPDVPPLPHGDVRIKGRVFDARGRPVAGAPVLCTPAQIVPLTQSQALEYATTTNDKGRFVVEGLPDASGYWVSAHAKGWQGNGWTRGRPQDPEVKITLHELVYDRLSFFDTEGRPIDLSRRRLRPWRWIQMLLPDGSGLSTLLGIPESDFQIAPNEKLIVSPRADPPEDPGMRQEHDTGPMTIAIPGYRRVVTPTGARSFKEWPRPTRIVLHKDTELDLATFVVEFPEISPPASWGALGRWFELSLTAIWLGEDRGRVVTSRKDTFVAPRDQVLELRQWGHEPLRYERFESGEVIRLKPEWPEYAFVSIRVGPDRDGPPHPIYSIDGRDQAMYGKVVRPNLVLFGPLPVGEYSFRRYPDALLASDADPADRFGPVTLRPGHQVLEWE